MKTWLLACPRCAAAGVALLLAALLVTSITERVPGDPIPPRVERLR